MRYEVLIADQVDGSALEVFERGEARGKFAVSAPGKMSRAKVLASIGAADALVVRSTIMVDAEMLAAAPKLKAIVRAGTGVDNIDVGEATRRGVAVMNTPDGNSIAAAEHAFGLMLALARNIPAAHGALSAGQWDRKAFVGVELRGKTLGVVGFGRIGQAVAKRARAFEMSILAFDPYNPQLARLASEMRCELVDLDTLWARSDFVTLHPWLSEETRGMINRQTLAKMKPGARLINIARGALIVDADLAEAIRSGQIAGAALDVFDPEPPSPDNPLLNLPGVIHTPHLAASTREAQIAVAVEAAHHVIHALLHHEYDGLVNPEALKSRKQ